MNQDVGLAEQLTKGLATGGRLEVEPRATFAQSDFGDDAGFIPGGGIDPQDICTKSREKAGRHRPRYDPCEIENPQA